MSQVTQSTRVCERSHMPTMSARPRTGEHGHFSLAATSASLLLVRAARGRRGGEE